VKRRGHSRRQRGGSSGPSSANRASGPSSANRASGPSSANRASGPSSPSPVSVPGPPINIYLQLSGTTITNPSSDGTLADVTPLSTGTSMITLKFKNPIKFAGATWSKWFNGRWIPVGTYLTTNPNSSYIFQATPTGTNGLKTIKKAGIPIGATNIAMPASGGISTSTITINNITTNNSNFAAGVSTTSSPINNQTVNIRITLNTLQ
jgi:hypothetical protein